MKLKKKNYSEYKEKYNRQWCIHCPKLAIITLLHFSQEHFQLKTWEIKSSLFPCAVRVPFLLSRGNNYQTVWHIFPVFLLFHININIVKIIYGVVLWGFLIFHNWYHTYIFFVLLFSLFRFMNADIVGPSSILHNINRPLSIHLLTEMVF